MGRGVKEEIQYKIKTKEDKIMENIQIKPVMEHFEVVINGIIAFIADTKEQAIKELKLQLTY